MNKKNYEEMLFESKKRLSDQKVPKEKYESIAKLREYLLSIAAERAKIHRQIIKNEIEQAEKNVICEEKIIGLKIDAKRLKDAIKDETANVDKVVRNHIMDRIDDNSQVTLEMIRFVAKVNDLFASEIDKFKVPFEIAGKERTFTELVERNKKLIKTCAKKGEITGSIYKDYYNLFLDYKNYILLRNNSIIDASNKLRVDVSQKTQIINRIKSYYDKQDYKLEDRNHEIAVIDSEIKNLLSKAKFDIFARREKDEKRQELIDSLAYVEFNDIVIYNQYMSHSLKEAVEEANRNENTENEINRVIRELEKFINIHDLGKLKAELSALFDKSLVLQKIKDGIKDKNYTEITDDLKKLEGYDIQALKPVREAAEFNEKIYENIVKKQDVLINKYESSDIFLINNIDYSVIDDVILLAKAEKFVEDIDSIYEKSMSELAECNSESKKCSLIGTYSSGIFNVIEGFKSELEELMNKSDNDINFVDKEGFSKLYDRVLAVEKEAKILYSDYLKLTFSYHEEDENLDEIKNFIDNESELTEKEINEHCASIELVKQKKQNLTNLLKFKNAGLMHEKKILAMIIHLLELKEEYKCINEKLKEAREQQFEAKSVYVYEKNYGSVAQEVVQMKYEDADNLYYWMNKNN